MPLIAFVSLPFIISLVFSFIALQRLNSRTVLITYLVILGIGLFLIFVNVTSCYSCGNILGVIEFLGISIPLAIPSLIGLLIGFKIAGMIKNRTIIK